MSNSRKFEKTKAPVTSESNELWKLCARWTEIETISGILRILYPKSRNCKKKKVGVRGGIVVTLLRGRRYFVTRFLDYKK